MRKPGFHIALAWSAALCAVSAPSHAALPLETESARLPGARQFELETVFEYQTSPDGTEAAVPLALEYGITRRWSVLVEPVVFTAIHPKTGSRAQGIGDLEVTLFHGLASEHGSRPALAAALEVKVPTARNQLIGTGKTDYTLYGIVSKSFGRYEAHFNLGYTFVGKPVGMELKDFVNFSIAGEYHLNPKFDIVAEILANTSSARGGGEGGTTGGGGPITGVSPEAAAGEVVGLLGFRYAVHSNQALSLGVTYDNNNAVLIRTGATLRF